MRKKILLVDDSSTALLLEQIMRQSIEQGLAAGCTDYVMKPLDAHELLSKVRQHLGEEPAEGPGHVAR